MTHDGSNVVFIVHGSGAGPAYEAGLPNGIWHPLQWIAEKVNRSKTDYRAVHPQFPTGPTDQTSEVWLARVEEICEEEDIEIGEDTIFVLHSLGGALGLLFLERLAEQNKRVGDVYFLAPAVGRGTIDPGEGYNIDKFMEAVRNIDWQKVRATIGGKAYLFCDPGDEDPYISQDNFNFLAEKLGIERHDVPGAKHFGASDHPQAPTVWTFLSGSIGTSRDPDTAKPL